MNMVKYIRISIAAVLFIGYQLASAAPDNRMAPDFTLNTLSGKTVSLAELRKHGYVMLVFYATECVYCYSHIKDFNAIHHKYSGKSLTVAAINIAGENDSEIRDYVASNKIDYLVFLDQLRNIDVANAYQVAGTPTITVIDPNGSIVFYGHKLPDLRKWLPEL